MSLEAELRRAREHPDSLASILRLAAAKMVLCCCWPVSKCVTVLSCFDTLIVAYFTWKSGLLLGDTIDDPNWLTVLSFVILLGFLVCQVLATVFIILAEKRQLAHYCLPRLVLIGGLLICSVIAFLITMIYVFGAAKSMNEFIFGSYDYFFPNELDNQERDEMSRELKLYAWAFLALVTVYALYNLFVLALTRKFYQHLNQFRPVPQTEPTVPAYNPDFPAPVPPHHHQDPVKGAVYPQLP